MLIFALELCVRERHPSAVTGAADMHGLILDPQSELGLCPPITNPLFLPVCVPDLLSLALFLSFHTQQKEHPDSPLQPPRSHSDVSDQQLLCDTSQITNK